MPKIIGESIDYLCNFQMKAGKGSIKRGNTKLFYEAARRVQRDPLTYLAATALVDRVHEDDVVLIATGCRNLPVLPYGESDGPIGAAALARSLDISLGARTVITVEKDNVEATEAVVRASGAYLRQQEDFYRVPGAVVVDTYPLGEEAGKKYAVELIDKYKPAAIIFCEKHGPNAMGVLHTVTGYKINKEEMANAYFLATEAEKRGILTIGAGDGGNEIGNGIIYDAVRAIPGYGAECVCGCGGGLATVSKTDIFVAASISNWGLYGVTAMLAYLKGNINIIHDIETERRMLEACAYFGSVDGTTMRPVPRVDGTSLEAGQAFVTLLREIVSNGMKKVARHV
ncbi:MAG TPA: DUF4392 domain-containing protein [Firmicutes bacterium]|nr:DUF4392 domain-containing protein [Bacillota bacterium]